MSRKFVYEQTHRANVALDAAFPTAANDAEKVLFEVKVTRRLLCQMILALTLICRGSYRGVIEFLRDLLGVHISAGTVHNVHEAAARQAGVINSGIALSGVRVGLHDEIFQGPRPVLALTFTHAGHAASCASLVALAASFAVMSVFDRNQCEFQMRQEPRSGKICFKGHLLRAQRASRSGTRRGRCEVDVLLSAGRRDAPRRRHLGRASDGRQSAGLEPRLRLPTRDKARVSGLALSGTPCHGDVFHIQHQFETLTNTLTQIAQGDTSRCRKLQAKIDKASCAHASDLVEQLDLAHKDAARSQALAREGHDVLSLAGPEVQRAKSCTTSSPPRYSCASTKMYGASAPCGWRCRISATVCSRSPACSTANSWPSRRRTT
ncbi:MAG: hypothetical protein JF606_23515 [Burkholderiales bacterium]|nr:hypothetical protein [Burkholderiales bacterium]